MSVTIRSKEQLQRAYEDLADLRKAKKKILAGGQAYAMAKQEVTRASLKEINQEINDLEEAIAAYESRGSTRRKAKRIIPLE